MKNLLKVTIAIIFLAVTTSCSNEEPTPESVSNEPLAGTVNGKDFTALGGKSFDRFGGEVAINITNIAADCTSSVLDYKLYVSTDVPKEVGVIPDANVAFHDENFTPLNFLDARVEIVSITDTQIEVKITADSSTDNVVDGVFTVSYCN